jgi:DNA polymerase-1
MKEPATADTDIQGEAPQGESPMHLVLIDGSGFIFRAFHALPPMTRPDGTPVNAVFGFTNMLARLLKDHAGTHIAVIFDAGRLTFRNRLYDAYKANRLPAPEELIPQFILTREATEAFGVPAIELIDWEADDLIAAYALAAETAGWRTTIVSSDKDLMQLIRPAVMMMDPLKQKPIGPAEVMEKFGVTPDKVIEVQALIGDSSDNVPGVPGIGPKGAAQLIAEFGDLESVLAAAPSMKPSKRRDMLIEHADKARISRELVTLRTDAPMPLPLDALIVKQPDVPHLIAWLGAQGFRSTISRLGLSAPAAEAPKPADAPPVPASDVDFGNYESVTTVEALRVWADGARAAGCFALDTETDGLDAMRASLVGLSMATEAGHACYVPLRHEILAEQIPLAAAIEILGPLFADPAVL